jgi:BirA family biotin operon repressor/biotin-[acetyl-CoA-carboxylase] ligase
VGWLPLLTGVAVAEAVTRATGLRVGLKWPNDVVVEDRKLAGILAERVDSAVVVGVGLNVSLGTDERPAPQATSLAIEGCPGPDRTELLADVLRALAGWLGRWEGGDDEAVRAAYLGACRTIGREVSVEQPGGAVLAGTAVDVDGTGRLVVRVAGDETFAVAAGDVQHLR